MQHQSKDSDILLTPKSSDTDKKVIHWRELDILRGSAAVMMIVNHLGYQTLAPSQLDGSFVGNIVFVGSFAPVLFFFVTGVGYGLQSSQRKKADRWYVTLNKVAILILADQLTHWSEGNWLGLDFLGFIGLSSLVLEFLRNSRFPLTYCIMGLASVSLLRYCFGPYIHSWGYDQQLWGVIGWIIGTSSTPGVSYPLSPWIAYPFAGYLTGVTAMHYKGFIETHRVQVIWGLLILGVFPLGAGLILSQHGSSFFRWGTVAIGFYVVSFAVLLNSLAWSLVICGKPSLKVCQTALSLKGVASLAVVPTHYLLIYLVNFFGGEKLNLFSFYLVAICVLTTSFFIARSVEGLSHKMRQIQNQKVAWFGFVTMLLLAIGVILIFRQESTFINRLTLAFGQLILCLLLVIRPPVLRPRVRPGTIVP